MPRKYIPVAERRALRDASAPPNGQNAKTKAAQTAQNIRWMLTKANETAVVEYIQSLPTSESLPLLQLMRQNVDAAAQAIEAKIRATRIDVCAYCEGPQKGRGWRMETSRLDHTTLQQRPIKFCSDYCVVMYNQKQQGGIAAMPDRGGKFGPDSPSNSGNPGTPGNPISPVKPPNGETTDAGPSPVREAGN